MIAEAPSIPLDDTRPLPRWAALLLTREPGTALALFRAGLGASLLISMLTVIAHGDVAALWLAPVHGGYTAPVQTGLFKMIGGVAPAQLHAMIAVTVICGAMLLFGLGGRLPAIVALFTYPAITGIDPEAGGSYDVLMTNALWLAVLGSTTATLSLDCFFRERRWTSAREVFAWPRWLMMFQLVLVYFSTGIQKVSDTWVPGGRLSAIWFIMQQPTWHHAPMAWLAHVFPLTQLATLATWCFEVSSPLLLILIALQNRGRFAKLPLRRAWATFGITLHLGIAASLVLGCFSPLMISLYASLISARAASSAPR